MLRRLQIFSFLARQSHRSSVQDLRQAASLTKSRTILPISKLPSTAPLSIKARNAEQPFLSAHREFSNKVTVSADSEAIVPPIVRDNHIIVNRRDGGTSMKLPFYWLRDNCRCPKCFHPVTNQLLHNIIDLDLNISATEVTCSKDSDILITWNDGHRSTYPLQWLSEHAPGVGNSMKSCQPRRTCWSGGSFQMPQYSFSALKNKPGTLKSLFQELNEYGALLIEGVESEASDDLEEITNMIAGGCQSTFFGLGIMVVQSDLKMADTAYTNLALPLHTDSTYFDQPCRGMVLQVTEREGEGGRTVLTDGFNAAEQLANQEPELFEILCREDLIGQYIGPGGHHTGTGPVIKVNPSTNQVERLRFNALDRAPISHISQESLRDFYRAYQGLARLIYDEENALKIALRPDQVVVYDNWRVLHGREAFTGHRSLRVAYLRHDDWMSNVRVIGELNV